MSLFIGAFYDENVEYFLQIAGTQILRGSRLEVFCKKGVLKGFAKFTGKHLCHRFNFIKKRH